MKLSLRNRVTKTKSHLNTLFFELKLRIYIAVFASYDLNTVFKGKRIAIVGPADSAMAEKRGSYIDEFDVVVRVNKSPRLLKDKSIHEYLGSRTDVLFHNLNETYGDKGGKLEFDLYQQQQLQYLISFIRVNDPTNMNIWTLRYLKNYRHKLNNKLRIIPSSIFKEMVNEVAPKKPTTGLIALYTILKLDFEELFITGFTFFQTNFIDVYRPESHDPETAKKIEKSLHLHHNPSAELDLFKRALNNTHKKVILDKVLSEIVNK